MAPILDYFEERPQAGHGSVVFLILIVILSLLNPILIILNPSLFNTNGEIFPPLMLVFFYLIFFNLAAIIGLFFFFVASIFLGSLLGKIKLTLIAKPLKYLAMNANPFFFFFLLHLALTFYLIAYSL